MEIEEIWEDAVKEHNVGEFHEAHELFEDLWMELDERKEKDIVQTLAQIDALAVHINTGNIKAAQRLMKQLPELLRNMPKEYRNVNLMPIKKWTEETMVKIIGDDVDNLKKNIPPRLI
ncbi:MAG: hypothetical protein BEU04_02255 [Marine Group III euryarchaeote CG-Bathy1]|uniref:DUF309 domain-containing protein n=1 Tax=Marine Group III euryarchaeote CG-Bathy1 TaxID=1889001 RepID=A0A1J5T2Q6_9ARCH|nr:MAG: hypothetical protein BEU04_02255 [Marine Group III euryarchaeote CG-Bathy1]